MTNNETPFSWELALSVAVGIFWRWVLVGALPGVLLRELIVISSWAGLVFQIANSFLGLWVAVKWLFGPGRIGGAKLTITQTF